MPAASSSSPSVPVADQPRPDAPPSRSGPWLPALLYLLTLIFFLNQLGRVVLAPLLPAVERELRIGHGSAGGLFLFISLGYSLMLLASGFVAARISHRWSIVLSIGALGVVLIGLSLSRSLADMRVALLCLGLSAGLYLPSGMAKLTHLIEPRHWAKAIAIHETAPNLAALAAPLLAGVLFSALGWRGITALVGLIMAGVAVIYALADRSTQLRGDRPRLDLYREILSRRAVWVMVALFCLGIGGNIGTYSMLSLYLVAERGLDQSAASTLLTASRLATPVGVLLAGFVTDRLGLKRTIMAALLLTGSTTALIGLAHGAWLTALLFIQPLCAVCFFPAAFALLSGLGSPTTRNLTVSVTIPMAAVLGTGVVPSLIGLAGDAGHLGLGLTLWGVTITLGAWLLRLL